MSVITEYSIENQKKWNEVVHSFHDYEVFYLAEYSYAFMKENPQNGIPVLFYYENGEDRAVNVVFKRDIALDKKFENRIPIGEYYDLITPYGYGGFHGRIDDYEELNRSYSAFCVEKHYVSEFVRFELFSKYSSHYSLNRSDSYVESRTHNVVRNLEMPIEDIWMDFKQKVRKNVKKASRYGLEIILDETGAYLDEFLRIYHGTMERTNAETEFFFSREFFETLNEMHGNYMYFHVMYDEKIISTELVIYGSENCYSYLGGTDSEYFDMRPNDFLKYEIIKWASNKGLKNFVLGGGYGSDDGIFQYKSCLAPNGVTEFYIGKRILDSGMYDYLCEKRRTFSHSNNLKAIGYFPEYRE